MAIPILTNIDLNKNQVLQHVLHRLGTHPSSPSEGQFWYYNPEQRPYVRTSAANVAVLLATTTLDQIATAAADLALGSHKITGVLDPTGAQDVATKNYVDGQVGGARDVKESVRIATVGNDTLSGLAARDGVTPVAGDRVLAKAQTTGADNGIYVAAAGAWARSADADSSTEVTAGLYVWVEEGTANADTGWLLTTNNPITLGTTALVFTQVSALGQVTAGAGLTKTGNTLDVVGTAGRINVQADSVDIDTGYVGQSSITTLGTITTGTWTGTAVAVANGGTGATTAAGARTNLGAVGKYSATLSGATTSYTVLQSTHGLSANRQLVVQILEDATGIVVLTDVTINSSGDVTITFAVAPASNQYRIVIIG